MATQPQKNNLIKLFEDSIDSNLRSIESNEISLQKNQLIINDFDPSCQGIDNLIISIVNEINDIKTEISILYSDARNAGCGTITGATIIYPDTVIDSSYNLSDPLYESVNAYDINNQPLSNSNVGFGTFIIYTQDDSSASDLDGLGFFGLGIAYGDIGQCYGKLFPGVCTEDCSGYPGQITPKQNEIIRLQSELNELVLASNSLRTRRLDYQVRRWADRYTIKILIAENQSINQSINVLNNPAYDPFI